MKISLQLIIVLFFLFFSCKKEKSLRELVEENPVFHLENYTFFDPGKSLAERIVPPPGFILTYLKTMDNRDDYKVYIPAEKEIVLCAEYLDRLPELHKKILKERLVGIYFIENFLGSGMADFVLDKDNTIFCNLFLNPGTLHADISSWMTFRENSCFMSEEPGNDPAVTIIQDCGKEYTGLMYILLHETTHVVDYIFSITPYIDEAIKEIFAKKDTHTKFTENIWDTADTPVKEYDFDLRSKITFYGIDGGAKIDKKDAKTLYQRCEKTPFTSLYGSMNWADDLAEFFTWHYYTTVLNQLYEIRVYQGDSLIYTFEPMEGEKVRQRVPLVEEIFQAAADEL